MSTDTTNADTVATTLSDPQTRATLHLRPLVAVVLAVLAGAIVYGIYLAAFPVYDVPPHLLRMFPSDEDAVKREIAKNLARTLHATITLSLLGALLAAFLGGGEAVTRKRFVTSIPRLASGIIIAALLSALGAFLGAQAIIRLEFIEALGAMERTVIGQILMFGLLGTGVGFCVGAVGNDRRLVYKCLGAGLTAGILSGVLFPVFSAFALPRIQTDVVIPDGSGGIFGCVDQPGKIGVAAWLGTASLLLGLLLGPIANRNRQKVEG